MWIRNSFLGVCLCKLVWPLWFVCFIIPQVFVMFCTFLAVHVNAIDFFFSFRAEQVFAKVFLVVCAVHMVVSCCFVLIWFEKLLACCTVDFSSVSELFTLARFTGHWPAVLTKELFPLSWMLWCCTDQGAGSRASKQPAQHGQGRLLDVCTLAEYMN